MDGALVGQQRTTPISWDTSRTKDGSQRVMVAAYTKEGSHGTRTSPAPAWAADLRLRRRRPRTPIAPETFDVQTSRRSKVKNRSSVARTRVMGRETSLELSCVRDIVPVCPVAS